jgi:hypothetical protein
VSEFSSVLELARETASEASRIKSNQQADENAERVLNRVSETRAALQKLEHAVGAARRLTAASGTAAVSLDGLDDGRSDLDRLAAQRNHLPSNTAFNMARQRITDVTKRVSGDFERAWGGWVRPAVAAVPVIKISQLTSADQATARDRWEALVKASRLPSPQADDIYAFKSDLDYLHELLDPLPELPEQVQGLYDRLAQLPALTLAEITDEQISQLRDKGLDVQIEVRRRGA